LTPESDEGAGFLDLRHSLLVQGLYQLEMNPTGEKGISNNSELVTGSLRDSDGLEFAMSSSAEEAMLREADTANFFLVKISFTGHTCEKGDHC
jgi:hypothetical protein